jgi:hypothetical protein
MHCDALCGGGRIIQLMGKAGGHCSEGSQLFLLFASNPRCCEDASPSLGMRFPEPLMSGLTPVTGMA